LYLRLALDGLVQLAVDIGDLLGPDLPLVMFQRQNML
jgi:hypothetical protein